jgi:NDP-sugar pyrophosphorylase family protein
MLPVAILAGGLATRLRPITEKIPKALVEVAGHPFISWQLNQLYCEGVKEVVVCTGYLGEIIEREIGNGQSFGLRISYSHDGDRLLGTGGALKKASSMLGDACFILYGDSYLPINFKEVAKVFANSNRSGLMTVLENKNKWDKSNVLFEDGRLTEYNKRSPQPEMRHIDYGLGILKTSCLAFYEENEAFDLADLYHQLSLTDQLIGYEVYNRFYEIGSPNGLKEAENYLKKKKWHQLR